MAKVTETIERSVALVARLFAITLGLVVGAVVAAEITDNTIIVEEISVPAELAQRGYTPAVVAYRILDEWRLIDETATTTKRRREVSLSHSQVELALPGFDLSISSIVDYFKAKLGRPRQRLRGSVVMLDSEAPECAEGCYTVFVDLEGPTPAHFSRAAPKRDVEALVRGAARQAVETLDPYLLANFYFAEGKQVQEDANAQLAREGEIRRILAIVLSSAPADDDPWAHTLIGVMLNARQDWAAAIPHLDDALRLDDAFASALNSRCWAKAHLPGQAQAAIADCRRALQINERSFETMDSLAFALEQAGAVEQAFEIIKCARRISAGAPSVEASYSRLLEALPRANTATPTEGACDALF